MVFGFFNDGFHNNNPGFPLFAGVEDIDDTKSKLAHDAYSVYVNDDYVGKKVLVAQGEKVDDIKGFLKNQGFSHFDTNLKGGEYSITCDKDESDHMKDTLNVYLHIR